MDKLLRLRHILCFGTLLLVTYPTLAQQPKISDVDRGVALEIEGGAFGGPKADAHDLEMKAPVGAGTDGEGAGVRGERAGVRRRDRIEEEHDRAGDASGSDGGGDGAVDGLRACGERRQREEDERPRELAGLPAPAQG